MTGVNGDHPKNGTSDELRFKRLVESIRDYAIFMLDPNGRILTWNRGAQAIKGYRPEEIIGSHFSKFYPQEQIDKGWPDYELAKAAEDGRFEDESWRVRKDGSRFWANVIITALRNEEGELVGFSKITRDFTEQREQAEALRQSEQRFRSLVEGASEYAIFVLDPQGFVISWNAGAERIKGYTADEIIGSHMSRFYPPDRIADGWPQHELRMAMMEGRFEDEGWRLRKDGSRFWANVMITALRDGTGALTGFSKITRDLTERRQYEQELQESEERFRLLVEGVTEYAILMLDCDGCVISWNAGAERINGYAAAEILGRHFSHFYTSEDIAGSAPWRHLLAAKEQGGITDESWRVRKDGSQYWASSVINRLLDSEGRHRGYVQVVQDLTQRRNAETLAATAQRMQEFIAMLAHELRNPLAPIRNAVALMGKKGLSDPTLESMRQTIDRQTSYLTRIIEELLDVNRIARGKFAIGKETVDLHEVLSRGLESSRPLIEGKGHRLHVDIPESPLLIQGDALRLTQAMVNLLNNAAKYTPQGGEIRLTANKRDTDVIIHVRDTGIGISPDDRDRVFELFTQVDPGVTGVGGLGVGLALVRRVIELHGGTVRVKSAGAGKGSDFIVRLPLPIQHLQLISPTEHAAPALARRLRVLVVDDNKDAADSLHLLLESLGQDVYTVYDGQTALEAAESLSPHVVFLDIGMPYMSGYDVASALNARHGDRTPVLVALTGWGQATDKQRAREHGFAHHFSKPISSSNLEAVLVEVSTGAT